jgi:glycosyltransferase involved in cell wall biosynthesis
MKLSVIIPCLNAEATLAVQLEALAEQRWSEPWELIISDNGSTDKSVKIALEYKDRFPSFRVIDASGKIRQSHALNEGVKAAIADSVAFCDADDEVVPGWVAAIGNALRKYDVVHGQFYFDKFNEATKAKLAFQGWKNGLYKRQFLPGGGAGNLGIKRWAHEAIGGFDESIPRFEDSDYYWKLQLEGFKLHYVPEAIIQVRMGRVNPSLSSLFRRGRTGTVGKCGLYKRYRHLGMLPNPPLKKSMANWLQIIIKGASGDYKTKQKRAIWMEQFVLKTGELVGEIQGRIMNPCKPYHPRNKASGNTSIQSANSASNNDRRLGENG